MIDEFADRFRRRHILKTFPDGRARCSTREVAQNFLDDSNREGNPVALRSGSDDPARLISLDVARALHGILAAKRRDERAK